MDGPLRSRGPRVDPFERHSRRYEEWFLAHENAYRAEIRALKELTPSGKRGLEVGVGTGRFAVPLGIRLGVDPSPSMLGVARERGIQVVLAAGEALPFPDGSLDPVLLVTTVCFLEDLDRTLREIRRVLRPAGSIVVGLVDRASPLGAEYMARRQDSVFYGPARFYSVTEILEALERAGFGSFETRETLFGPPSRTPALEEVRAGYGEGSFVAVRGILPGSDKPKMEPGGRS